MTSKTTKKTNKEVNSRLQETPVAIIGMGGLFPEARTVEDYWNNIINKVDCIIDVPESRWKVDDYFNEDASIPDKTYCKRGGFIPDVDFNPMEFGLPPNILEVTDVSQLLGLVVAKETLENAGYSDASAELRDKTGVILGVGGGNMIWNALVHSKIRTKVCAQVKALR